MPPQAGSTEGGQLAHGHKRAEFGNAFALSELTPPLTPRPGLDHYPVRLRRTTTTERFAWRLKQ